MAGKAARWAANSGEKKLYYKTNRFDDPIDRVRRNTPGEKKAAKLAVVWRYENHKITRGDMFAILDMLSLSE